MVVPKITPFTGIRATGPTAEYAWFSDLCGGDTDQIGVPDPARRSSFAHCRDIVTTAEQQGFMNILLPTSYMIGQEALPFAAAVAPTTSSISLLPALRLGEMHPPTLARSIATLDHLLAGRLCVNIISSPLPGMNESGDLRYRRTAEIIEILQSAWRGDRLIGAGDIYQFNLSAAPAKPYQPDGPLLYFGRLSPRARAVAARLCDVYLLWPLPEEELASVIADVSARDYATFLMRGVDEAKRIDLKGRTQDASSLGVAAQRSLRALADADGYAEEVLWTAIGDIRSGAGAAIVGSPGEVLEKLERYRTMGFWAFILSGYPLIEEARLFGSLVIAHLHRARLSEVMMHPMVQPY